MNELKIDWKKERPTDRQIIDLWQSIRFVPLNNFSDAAKTFMSSVELTHANGGIQIHKFKVKSNSHFDWFSSRNRLEEIKFVQKAVRHIDFKDYRKNLKITKDKPKVDLIHYWTDIYDIPSIIARTLAVGGAYKKINAQEAWRIGVEFVKEEFENRFDEFLVYQYAIPSANWFYDVAWDFSILIFDIKKNEVFLIDITDTD
tara:strand:+ start:15 stop:617 length:603 start_codon:yes stop_codon:yes gene_type:complete